VAGVTSGNDLAFCDGITRDHCGTWHQA